MTRKDKEARAIAMGWQWDEGGPFWYRNAPGASPFEPYQYARTLDEILDPFLYDQEPAP